MADNTILSTGSGGDTIATDDVGPGVKYQRVKITTGIDGVADPDVSITDPMPIDLREVVGATTQTGAGTEANVIRVTLPTDGTGVVQANAGINLNTSALATSALQLAAGHTVDQTGGPWQVDGPGAHAAALSGNPNMLGATSEDAADAAPANRIATEGQFGRLSQNGDGALYVIPSGPQQWDFHEDSSSALTDSTVHASPGAGLSLYVTDIVYSTGAATADNIFFEEATTTVLGPFFLEAVSGRGVAIHFGTPKKITVATALTVTTGQAIAHSIDITGFIAPG